MAIVSGLWGGYSGLADDTAGGGESTTYDFVSNQVVALRTTTGSQTITFPGVSWTPTFARFVLASATALDTIVADTAKDSISYGCCSGSAQWVVGMRFDNDSRFSNTTLVARNQGSTITVAFTSFAAGEITVSVVNSTGLAPLLAIEVWGGSLVTNVAVGTTTISSGSFGSVSTGFEPNLVFAGGVVDQSFPASFTTSAMEMGFASQRNKHIRQSGHFLLSAASEQVSVWPGQMVEGVELVGTDASNMYFCKDTVNGATAVFGYAALSLDSSIQAQASMFQAPTATGDQTLQDIYDSRTWSPDYIGGAASFATTLNARQVNSGGGDAFSFFSHRPEAQWCYRVQRGSNTGWGAEVTEDALIMSNVAATDTVAATWIAKVANGETLSVSDAATSGYYINGVMVGGAGEDPTDFATVEVIGSITHSHTATTAQTVSLGLVDSGGGAVSPASNDIILVFVGTSDTSDRSSAQLLCTGYTAAGTDQYANQTRDVNMLAQWKLSDGTETQITLPALATSGKALCATIYLLRGAHTTTPIDVTPTYGAAGNTCKFRPQAITPATAGALIIACGAGGPASPATDYTIIPGASEVTNHWRYVEQSNTNSLQMGAAVFANWLSGIKQFYEVGGGVVEGGSPCVAITVAIRPA